MKFLKIIVSISIGLIIVAGIILAVSFVTFDIEHYKPRIIQELGSLLGRDVRIDQLRLDFKIDGGLTIAVKGLSIADDPVFSKEKILTVDVIDLNTDMLALIFRRQIVISKIEISGPRVHLIRNKDGLFNVETLFDDSAHENRILGNSTKSFASVPVAVSRPQNGKKAGIAIPRTFIHAVRIENGALTFSDESLDPPLTIPLRQISFQATHLSFERPFPFAVKASLWADQQNIAVNGDIALDPANARVSLQRVKLETDLSLLHLRMLPFYGILQEQLSIEGECEGNLSLDDIAVRIGREGVSAFSANGELRAGRLSSGLLKAPLEDIQSRFHIDESNIAINELAAAYASGTISGQGRWSDYGRSNMLMFDLKVDGVQLGELIPRASMPVLSENGKPLELEGGVYAIFDAEGHGAQIPELRETLKGDGSLEIRGGKLHNINLLRFVLDKLSFIPDLAQNIQENLPPRYKKGLQSDETVLERAASTIQLKDQALYFSAELQSEGFIVTASGSLDFDQNLALTADFFITEDLARGMNASVPELSYLLDANRRIHVPFTSYQGKLQDIRIYPDVEELAAKVMQSRGKDELRKAIFRALDIEGSPAASPQTRGQAPAQGQEAPPEEPRPEEILIEGIFDAIFKGRETP
ncbi:MAG TPA: hypothetical protein DE315_01835 [Candidatus Omnitrophica bacterium]|nr:hypothetical protein [Candidatus Omnitrophota bacterium]